MIHIFKNVEFDVGNLVKIWFTYKGRIYANLFEIEYRPYYGIKIDVENKKIAKLVYFLKYEENINNLISFVSPKRENVFRFMLDILLEPHIDARLIIKHFIPSFDYYNLGADIEVTFDDGKELFKEIKNLEIMQKIL